MSGGKTNRILYFLCKSYLYSNFLDFIPTMHYKILGVSTFDITSFWDWN